MVFVLFSVTFGRFCELLCYEFMGFLGFLVLCGECWFMVWLGFEFAYFVGFLYL